MEVRFAHVLIDEFVDFNQLPHNSYGKRMQFKGLP
jgi:hypothetical protein